MNSDPDGQQRQSSGIIGRNAGIKVEKAIFDVSDRRSSGVPGDTEIDIVRCLRLW